MRSRRNLGLLQCIGVQSLLDSNYNRPVLLFTRMLDRVTLIFKATLVLLRRECDGRYIVELETQYPYLGLRGPKLE